MFLLYFSRKKVNSFKNFHYFLPKVGILLGPASSTAQNTASKIWKMKNESIHHVVRKIKKLLEFQNLITTKNIDSRKITTSYLTKAFSFLSYCKLSNLIEFQLSFIQKRFILKFNACGFCFRTHESVSWIRFDKSVTWAFLNIYYLGKIS